MPRGVARASVARRRDAMAGSPPNRFNFVYAATKAEEKSRERERNRGIKRGSFACKRRRELGNSLEKSLTFL